MGTSTYRADFSGADIDAAATLNEQQRANLRKSHFAIAGEGTKTGVSEMRDAYRPLEDETMKPVEDLHHLPDNIKLGNDKPDYVSSNRAQFTTSDSNFRSTIPPGLQKTHFELGHDTKKYYETMTRSELKTYDDFVPEKKTYNYQVSHLQMNEGNQKDMYVSEAAANFIPRDNERSEVHDLRRFQNSHIVIGDAKGKLPMSAT